MDLSQQVVSDQLKKKIYDDLADVVIAALERQQILTDDAAESAQFILRRVEKATTLQDLTQALRELSSRWDIYTNVFLDLKKQDLIGKVERELQQLTSKNQ